MCMMFRTNLNRAETILVEDSLKDAKIRINLYFELRFQW